MLYCCRPVVEAGALQLTVILVGEIAVADVIPPKVMADGPVAVKSMALICGFEPSELVDQFTYPKPLTVVPSVGENLKVMVQVLEAEIDVLVPVKQVELFTVNCEGADAIELI